MSSPFRHFALRGLILVLAGISSGVVEGQDAPSFRCDSAGTGPDSITAALPFVTNITSDVPQTCFDTALGERCFYTYVPECALGKEVPLVFDIHGIGSCPLQLAAYSGWVQKATEECFILAMPLGVTDPTVTDTTCFSFPGGIPFSSGNNTFTSADCCCMEDQLSFVDPAETNDPAFLRSVVTNLAESFSSDSDDVATIDTTRIYMSGHSNGCIASLAMAATSSDLVAAVCCMAGALIQPFAADYTPVPIWTVHGLKDSTIPAEGQVFEWVGAGFLSLTARMDYISEKNGCSNVTTETPLLDDQGAVVGTTFTRSDCGEDGATVEMVTLNEAGHVPYLNVPTDDPGAAVTTVDTTSMAWDFCKAFSNTNAPAALSPAPTPAAPASSGSSTDPIIPPTSAATTRTPSFETVIMGLLSFGVAPMMFFGLD